MANSNTSGSMGSPDMTTRTGLMILRGLPVGEEKAHVCPLQQQQHERGCSQVHEYSGMMEGKPDPIRCLPDRLFEQSAKERELPHVLSEAFRKQYETDISEVVIRGRRFRLFVPRSIDRFSTPMTYSTSFRYGRRYGTLLLFWLMKWQACRLIPSGASWKLARAGSARCGCGIFRPRYHYDRT